MNDLEEAVFELIDKMMNRAFRTCNRRKTFDEDQENGGNGMKAIVGGMVCIGAIMVFVFGILFGWPVYSVWQQNKAGEAELARAEQNRQIAIQEARAKEESAKSLANAEVIRAEGVARANEIIGNSLKDNEAYIHYLWIEALRESKSDVIYIPTEAGIPITESSRFHITRQQAEAAAKK